MRPLTVTWGLAALAIAVSAIVVGNGTELDPVFIMVTAMIAAALGLLLYAIMPKRGSEATTAVATREGTLGGAGAGRSATAAMSPASPDLPAESVGS